MGSSLYNNKLIAIAGLKGSGKDSAAHMLEYILNAPALFRSYFGYKIFKKGPGKWSTTAFAKPLKQTLSILLNKPLEWFEDRYNKENVFVQLDTLILVDRSDIQCSLNVLSENKFSKLIKTGEPFPEGTYLSIRQLMQYYGTSIMRKFLKENIGINVTINNIHKNTIISDCRFKNEFTNIKDLGGTIIYINRPLVYPGTHLSERESYELYKDNKYDYVIYNNLSLKELFNNVKNCSKNLHF